MSYHVGQRLSLKSQLCTIRYTGEVAGKQGLWLGVEWDDATRGKHEGEYDGIRYFRCRSHSATAASFLRPDQKWDQPQTFAEALQGKYFQQDQARSNQIVYVSRNKQMEEVGFEKFARRQAELRGINVIVLDRMCIRHTAGSGGDAKVTQSCANILELDLGANLFESYDDALDLCSHMPRLTRLSLAGNRFLATRECYKKLFSSIRTVDLSDTLLTEHEISRCLTAFPNLEELLLANNSITFWNAVTLTSNLRIVDLSENSLTALSDVQHVLGINTVTSLKVKHNQISMVWREEHQDTILSSNLEDLDVGQNNIVSWSMFDALRTSLPALKHLRISNNPIFEDPHSADNKPLSAADGYMLAIARLPNLSTLNYSKISDKERLNADKFYLEQIALQLSLAEASDEVTILNEHPLWHALCQEYGKPVVSRATAPNMVNSRSLAARMVSLDIYEAHSRSAEGSSHKWTARIPKSFNVYALYGLVGKKLNVIPLELKLVWETGERDPIAPEMASTAPEWWDSDEEDAADQDSKGGWVDRDVELVPGTRSLATYFDGHQATIRVEMKGSDR